MGDEGGERHGVPNLPAAEIRLHRAKRLSRAGALADQFDIRDSLRARISVGARAVDHHVRNGARTSSYPSCAVLWVSASRVGRSAMAR